MTILAGQPVTADEYNADVTDYVDDILASDETITTTLTDVGGVTQSITTPSCRSRVRIAR